MIKKERKEIKLARHYCDICEKEFSPYYQMGGTQCLVCKRDLCNKHRNFESEEYPDETSVYCPDCHKIGRKYFTQLRMLRRKFDKDFEDIERKMKEECLQSLKKKT